MLDDLLKRMKVEKGDISRISLYRQPGNGTNYHVLVRYTDNYGKKRVLGEITLPNRTSKKKRKTACAV